MPIRRIEKKKYLRYRRKILCSKCSKDLENEKYYYKSGKRADLRYYCAECGEALYIEIGDSEINDNEWEYDKETNTWILEELD